jgi:ribonuclease BN (tRNA processing enzyme)
MARRERPWTAEEQEALLRHHVEEHLLPDEVGKLAARANVKAVVLTHLNDNYVRVLRKLRSTFPAECSSRRI